MVGEIEAYVARPEKPTTKYIVIFSDVFGHVLKNVQLIADSFASRGFICVVPDILHGDPLSPQTMDFATENTSSYLGFAWKGVKLLAVAPTFAYWLWNHGDAQTTPIIDSVLTTLRSDTTNWGATKIGSVGYCFGGRYAILSGATEKVDAFATAHPSFVSVSSDIPPIIKPGLLCLAEIDMVFTAAMKDQTCKILAEHPDRQGRPNVEVKMYMGQKHGYAVRGQEEDPVVRKARDDTLGEMVSFFEKHL